MSNINMPMALKTIDEQLGSETTRAYEHAVDRAPHLEGMAFILREGGGSFQPSELGLAGGYVTLDPSREHYQEAINSGLAGQRMGEFSKFFRERSIVPRTGELVTSILLHELGHADDFHNYIQRAGGDVRAAFKLAREVRNSELATLPLKAPTSAAAKAWNNNTNSYRDKIRQSGIKDSDWPKKLLDNAAKYAELPCEKVADRFALGVLATMYAK